MATTSHRAPLLVSLVILLGVGGRWLRGEQATPKDPPVASAALDSQLALVERAAQGEKKSGSRKTPRPPSGTRRRTRRPNPARGKTATERDSASIGTGALRSDRTPLSVVDPGAMPRYRADRVQAEGRQGSDQPRRASGRRRTRATPEPPPPLIDVERASASELERLPRVGPSLARRIVEDRKAHGPFRSLEGLQRVRGIGPALSRQLQAYVTFGDTGRP